MTQLGSSGRTYDETGNTTSVGGTQREYAYNDAGRLKEAKQNGSVSGTYRYNAKGEQVQRTAGSVTTVFVYDEAGSLLGQYDNATGTSIQSYAWMGGIPVGTISGTTLHYVEADHLGTPRAVVNATSQKAIWRWDLNSEAFGNTAPNTDPDADGTPYVFDRRFPGQRHDQASGLSYNYFRDYEAATGRYSQSDPIGLAGGISTYGYVAGNPLRYMDPTGEIIPLLAIAGGVWLVAEIGLTIYDIYDTYQTVTDPCASDMRKGAAVGLLIAGIFLPGGGYGMIDNAAAKLDDVAEATARSGDELADTADNLGARVDEIHGALDPIAASRRTTAGLDTVEGARVLAAGGRDLSPAQRALMTPREAAARMPGAHAEVTALRHASQNGLTPSQMAVSRPICPACRAAIEQSGGHVTSPTTAVWPKP